MSTRCLSTASAIESGPWPSPDEIITAPDTPRSPASSMISGIAGAGAVMTIKSGTKGKDFRSGDVCCSVDGLISAD